MLQALGWLEFKGRLRDARRWTASSLTSDRFRRGGTSGGAGDDGAW